MAGGLVASDTDRRSRVDGVPDFVLAHTEEWLDHFRMEGHNPVPLAAGVEAAIYDLGGGLVAKVRRERRCSNGLT